MKTVIVDERISDRSKSTLIRLGFRVIPLHASERLPAAICSHTDILTFTTKDMLITSKDYATKNHTLISDIKNALPNVEIRLSNDVFSQEYPHDAIFNALMMGEYLFAKADTVSDAIKDYAKEANLTLVNVNQGYPACTVLKLTEKIAVTADDGMAKALSDKGITVYKIENSDKIKLPPYPYGFIGGCAGVFEDKVYFAGDLHFHPSCDIIKAAAAAAGLECVSLADGENLLDVGRLVFYDNGIDDYNGKRQ